MLHIILTVLGVAINPSLSHAQIPADQAPTKSQAALTALGNDYWDAFLRNNPTYATFIGDERFNGNLEDLSERARQTELAEIREFRRRLKAIDPTGYAPQDLVTAEILAAFLDFDEGMRSHNFHEWNIDHIQGPQSWFMQILNFTPLKTERHGMDLTARWKALPHYFDQYQNNLRAGLQNKRVTPRIAVERTIKQLDALLAKSPEESPFGQKIKTLPKELTAQHQTRLTQALRQNVWPALQNFNAFLKNEYLEKSRKEKVGIYETEGGPQAYAFLIRYHTTSTFTASDLHQTGLQEVASIRSEMEELAKKMGHQGDLEEFLAKVRSDPKNFFEKREEITASAKKYFSLASLKLPAFFRVLPKIPCEVKAIEDYREKDAVGAFYYQPDEQGKRPGIYYINTYDPPSRPRYTMAALAVHEAVPGHHLQIALSLEAKNLPAFRRLRDSTAFTEGWGLYTERLAEEMGLYLNDRDRLGMLTYQIWRASRLVVDTGIHAMGWSRQKAIDYLKSNAPLKDEEVINEIDRYIIWPGQALAYKTGQREIQALRRQAESHLGKKFDIREFHDIVLQNGSIPLPLLRQLVQYWLKSKA